MHLRPRLARKPDKSLRAAQRRYLVPPNRMGGWIARSPQGLSFFQPRLVLAVEGGPPADGFQDRQHARVVGDQQLAGRGAHEHLDPGGARQPLELREVGDVVVRAPDPEGEVAMHPAFRAGNLVFERFRAGRQRVGVGHLEHGGHAAEDRRP